VCTPSTRLNDRGYEAQIEAASLQRKPGTLGKPYNVSCVTPHWNILGCAVEYIRHCQHLGRVRSINNIVKLISSAVHLSLCFHQSVVPTFQA